MTRDEYVKASQQPNVIAEPILRGARDALHAMRSPLASHLDPILKNLPLPQPDLAIGDSIEERYDVQLEPDAARQILEALQSAEEKFGYNALFAERQINFIAMTWRAYVNSLA